MRADTLQQTALSRLETALSLAAENIIPVQIAQRSDDLDPRVSVGASLNSATRDGKIQDSTGTVRAITDATAGYVEANGSLDLTALQADVIDELTKHDAGWQEPELTNESEVAWEAGTNRYVGVIEIDVDDWDLHPHY